MIDRPSTIPTHSEFNERGFFPARRVSRWACGLDLGVMQDFSAISALQYSQLPLEPGSCDDWCDTDLRQKLGPGHYLLRHLQRFKLGLTYSQIADAVQAVMVGPLRGCPLIVDATGVGKPVVELLEAKGLTNVVPVVITGGYHEGRGDDGRTLHVPKQILIGHLQAALSLEELRIAADLPDAQLFLQELSNFRVTQTAAGNLSMNAREGQHDDLILSVALALHYLRGRRRNGWSVQHIW